MWSAVVFVVAVWLVAPLVHCEIRCTNGNETTWISQVKLSRGPWSVEIEHCTLRRCEGDNATNILETMQTNSPVQCLESSRKATHEGYELFPGVGHYKFHPQGVSWARARQACAEENAHLVIINSENEANVLKQLFARFPVESIKNAAMPNDIWVGVYEQGANGQYFTIFGETLRSTGFTRWNPGHPNSPGSNDCILFWRVNLGLTEWPSCTVTAPFVCEMEL